MLQQACGEDCLSRARWHEWYQRFKSGRTSIDLHRNDVYYSLIHIYSCNERETVESRNMKQEYRDGYPITLHR